MLRVFFGGSFDPVHEGHLDIVRHVSWRLSQQPLPFMIYFLPTAGNPFKGKPTQSTHRLAMLHLACDLLTSDGINIDICPIEIHQTPPVYTIDTVQKLAQQYPNDQRIFVMGGDGLSSFHRWRCHTQILEIVKIWAFSRAGHDGDIQSDVLSKITHDFDGFLHQSHQVIFYDNTPIRAISSTQIRQTLLQGGCPAHIPTPILDYIRSYKLYQNML